MPMTNQQAAELSKPSVGAFDLPTPFLASQFLAIFVPPLSIAFPAGRDQLDAKPYPSFPRRIGVATAVCDHEFGLRRSLPFRLGKWASWNVASASVTSAGEILPGRTPNGTPSLSPGTIHFAPLPRLVFATASLTFWPEQRCHPGRLRPIATGPPRPKRPPKIAAPKAKYPPLPIASSAASRSTAKGTRRVENATSPQCAAPTECPRTGLNWALVGDLAHRGAALAQAARDQPIPPARPKATSAASS